MSFNWQGTNDITLNIKVNHKCQIVFEFITNPCEINMDFKQIIDYEIQNDKKNHGTIVKIKIKCEKNAS